MSPQNFMLTAAALLSSAVCGTAGAQSSSPEALGREAAAHAAPAATTGSSRAPSGPVVNYRSTFEGYRGFAEQPLVGWRQSNDLVRQIGGWQVYAQEAQSGEPATTTASEAAPTNHDHMKMPAGGAASGAAGQVPPLAPAASSPGSSPAPVKSPPPAGHAMPTMQDHPAAPASKPAPVRDPKPAAAPSDKPASASSPHSGHQ